MENTKLIKKLIDYYLTGHNLTQEEHNAVTSLEKQLEAINFTDSSLQLKEKYTQDFQDYVEKFFKYRPKVYDWVSKDGKREFTHKQLCKYYEKAMNAKPLIV